MSATSSTSLNEGDSVDLPGREADSINSSLPEHGEDWVRLPKPGSHLLGLGRTYLFHLAKGGKIKTVSLCESGKRRGVRLVFLPSVRAFIEAEAARQNGGAL